MNNDSIRTQKQFIELLEKLTSEGKVYTVDKLSNRILEVIDNNLVDKEAEAIYTQFCKDFNIVLNSKLFFTLFRGYIYNLSSKEELDNLIKDDFYYSVLEFTTDKSEVTMKSLCLHLFNLDSNKVKQEVRTHIARCLTHIGFTSKRNSKGIKWINPVQLAQPTSITESINTTILQETNEPTQQPTLEHTQPTLTKSYKEEFETFKELYYKEKEKNKNLETQLQEFKNKATPVQTKVASGTPLDFLSND